MKQLMKVALMLVLLVSVLGAGLKADAAVTKPATTEKVEKKPYEYEFEVDDTAEYNGFTGAKKMVIKFDEEIKNVNNITTNDIYVEQITAEGNVKLPIIFKDIERTGNKFTIKFKNLKFVDHINKQDLQLVIKKGSLYFDQITDYVLPFKFYDLTPGFNSVFLDVANAQNINENIFKYNEPRNVMIQVPPVYMTKIETIHRYIKAVDPQNGTSKQSPNLSNIDVIADPIATRLKVEIKVDPKPNPDNQGQYERDLSRSTAGVNGFSMGQAGINSVTCKDTSVSDKECKEYNESNNIQLVAYSKDGRKLETRDFKMRVNDLTNDFKINDYVKADPKLYGKPISLYDFMASPTLLDNIMKETTLSKLNDFGVVYSVGNEAVVSSTDQFAMALQNKQFKKIILSKNFDLKTTEPIIVNRDVTISGGSITGDIQLGSGENDRTIRLEKTTINGELLINVGVNGTAVLDNVVVENSDSSVSHTKIISGGTNSIYLNDFESAGGVSLENKEPVRIVASNSNVGVEASEFTSLHLKGAGIVHLQGKFNDVELQPGMKGIHFISSSEINSLTNEIEGSELEKIEFTGTTVEVKNYTSLNDVLKSKLDGLENITGNQENIIELKMNGKSLPITNLPETRFELETSSEVKVGSSFQIGSNSVFKYLIKNNSEQILGVTGIELITLEGSDRTEYGIKLPESFKWEANTQYEAEFLITINKIQYKLKIPFTVSG